MTNKNVYTRLLVIGAALLFAQTAKAQAVNGNRHWHAGIGISMALTHTGFNGYLTPSAGYKRHTLYAGPKLLLSDSYLPYNNTWGIHAGYNYTLLGSKHWQAGTGIDYQCSFYKSFSPSIPDAGNPYNRVQELNLALHISYMAGATGKCNISLALGNGLFLETYHDIAAQQKHTNSGRTNMVRFTLGYKLF